MKIGYALALRLLARLSPRILRFLHRGRAGIVARKLLDLVVPSGGDEVSEVTGGPLKGARMRLDPRKQKEMLIGTYESGVQQALGRYAGRGDIVFDVGAHVGFFSLIASKIVGDQGRVVACEPDPYMSERLSTNLSLNKGTNVIWQKVAVGEKATRKTFAPGGGAGTGHLSKDGSMTVPVVSLDELAEKWGPPKVVKVDVEGGELDVLAGAGKVLENHHPVMIIEAHGEQNEASAAAMLEQFNYNIQYIDDVSGRRHLLGTPSE